MDQAMFDHMTRSFALAQPRRRLMQSVGAAALAGLLARFGWGSDAEAKKKHRKKKKKCKRGKRKCNGKCIPQANCCVDGDCATDETCEAGQCLTKRVECQVDDDCAAGFICFNGICADDECGNDADCGPGKICQNGLCVTDDNQGTCVDAGECASNESCVAGQCKCIFPQKPCGDHCCVSDATCVNGQCVLGQGTCNVGEDICDSDVVPCNGNASCNCGLRLDDGEPRCIQFVDDSRNNCNCSNDFQCEQDFGPGTICIKGGPTCDTCHATNAGLCATLCPGSI